MDSRTSSDGGGPPTSPTKETTVLKYLDEGKPKAPSFNNNLTSGMVGGVKGGVGPSPYPVETTSKATSVAPNAKTLTSEKPEVQSWTKVFTRRTFLNDLKVKIFFF